VLEAYFSFYEFLGCLTQHLNNQSALESRKRNTSKKCEGAIDPGISSRAADADPAEFPRARHGGLKNHVGKVERGIKDGAFEQLREGRTGVVPTPESVATERVTSSRGVQYEV
jgi:hypothetical protein